MHSSILRGALILGAAMVALTASGRGQAQAPPYPPPPPVAAPAPPAGSEAADIAACLCLHRGIGTLGAAMSARREAYDSLQNRIAGLDAQLQRMRTGMNVDDPAAVARFRQLLAQRDAAFRRSTGPAASDLANAVSRYDASVNEYNARCANHPRDPALLAQVQATLSCPTP